MFLFLIVFNLITIICICVLLVGLYNKNTNVFCKTKRRLDGKTVIVTGGTTGIGLEVATDFAQRGAKVIVACPIEEEGCNGKKVIITKSGNENVFFDHLDLSSFTSIKRFAANILEREDRLDILMNNAALNGKKYLTENDFNVIMQVNYLGPVLLTFLLLPLLKKSGKTEEPSRIVNVSSMAHNIGKIDYLGWRETGFPYKYYANSKLSLTLFTRELASRLNDCNVIVNVLDTGIVGTRIYKSITNNFIGSIVIIFATILSKNLFEGAQTSIHVAVCEKAQDKNGKYFSNCKVSKPGYPTKFDDDKITKLLWKKTIDMLILNDESINIIAESLKL